MATFSADLIHGVLPVIIALDPEMVVVGGGMSVAGDALINPIRSEVERSSDFPQVVLGSALGDEGVVLGAVRSALNEAEDRLFANLAPADADKDDFAAHDS